VRRFIGYGYSYVAVASDIAMMTSRASEWLGSLRDQPVPVSAPTAAY
jgi:2-dehydro-3-deoxyglucarate aldolase/4-hydroxy-2-oxoheptanedioate aldolase